MKKYGRIFLKIVLWIIVSVIALILLVVVLIQIPAVQNFAKDKAVSFLEGKIHTPVRIGHISLGLPKLIVLEDVYFEDQKRDTLLAGEKLKVDISLLKLLDNQVEINEINLQGITSHISRTMPDSAFNFTYIIKAFASEQKKKPDPNDTASMKFSISKIILDRIHIKYNDAVSGNDIAFNLGHFDTNIKDFDLDKMKFTVPKITLSDVNAKVIQHQVAAAATAAATDTASSTPMNYDLKLGTLDLSKIKVDYKNEASALKTKVDLGKFLVELDSIDLKNQRVVIKNIELNNTTAALATGRPATASDVKTTVKEAAKTAVDKDTTDNAPTEKGWTVRLNKVAFDNNDIQFDNNASKRIPHGIDFMHLGIKGLTVDADSIYYSPTTISGKINQFAFSEQSGVQVKQFHTQFLYGQKESFMKDLLLQTPNTIIRNYVDVKYPSIASISDNLGQLQINANLVNSKLAFKDVLAFVPSLANTPPFKGNANAILNINGKVTGKVSDLTIQNFNITGLGQTKIIASAHLKGLPDVDKAYFDLNIQDFSTTARDIARLAPAGTIPSSVRIPESLSLKGTFKGSIKNFNTDMMLRSSYGNIHAIAGMNNGGKSYSANINMNNFNVGRLIKQEKTVGRLTFNAKVKGSGTDLKSANAAFSADVIRADVRICLPQFSI